MAGADRLLMPKLGLTMTEGMVSAWQVKEGEAFKAGQVLAIVESDKTAYELEAPADGVLEQILVQPAETVPVGTPIARLGGGKAGPASPVPPGTAPDKGKAKATPPAAAQVPPAAPRAGSGQGAARIVATPLARRLAARWGIDLAAIAGSGPRGRVQAADVEAAAAARAAPVAPRVEQRGDIPLFHLAIDVEVSGTLAMREQLNATSGRPRTTLTHFLVAAAVHALRQLPAMNRVWGEGAIVAHDRIDIGLALDSEEGLGFVVARDLGQDRFGRLVAKVDEVMALAAEGALQAEDRGGAALTIADGGLYDLRAMTCTLLPGQSALLGVGSVQELFRPDAAGAPVLRRELGVVLSADRRVHSLASARAFLEAFRAALAEPLLFLAG